ncbi:tRNA (adenosine(37)-N6)-threonylcarbamoyltransferase complex dimerization subunit type 1 TsaB [Nakamurella endophytica]|uniref:tRNA (Adenosine(37)-N6)-threonylcarbamoyltransferase complex dimerization subunit type 1 TsaB n=1 Tax=Nakamurella endophytica TaxID=1748367 RepID=A0A917SYR9_9ACTN|nr:tRNA (adenosine(37)-N6)-threonylcarbamoyltransferase complex dimerization subunit type 1 TsaB [Nakamurella endophytica]GGM02975.1 tRNA (adenosine(37)-N6)-threonylcarbamoyltransferase complex dimerization subunit type 1 TsaB [Nakamurella endophytica]
MLVLAVDTSTPAITAGAVTVRHPHELVGGAGRPVETVSAAEVVDAFGHAEQLLPLVTRVLDGAGRDLREVDAVVVGLGPGPYTGLRVGIATAQALGDGLGVAVHGVPGHDGVARAVLAGRGGTAAPAAVPGPFVVVTDARRREVYLSAYGSDGRRLLGPQVLSPAAVAGVLAEHGIRPVLAAGRGAGLLDGHLELPGWDALLDLPAGLAAAAARALVTGAVPGPLVPLYLRRPDATVPRTPIGVAPAGAAS